MTPPGFLRPRLLVLSFDAELLAVANFIPVHTAAVGHRDLLPDAKNETGLDQYQVGRYDGWYRHVILSMLASAYLRVTAAADPNAAATWWPSARQQSAVSRYT